MNRTYPEKIAAIIAGLLLAGACGTGAAPDAGPSPDATAPASARLLEPPTATLPDGAVVRLELAITPEEREQGLMFRRSLAADHGMLFVFEQSATWPFWMKDTWIPLDLVFLDESGTVTQVFADVQPCRAEPCPKYIPARPARAVLELPAGAAAAHGVRPGVRLQFARVPDYPAG